MSLEQADNASLGIELICRHTCCFASILQAFAPTCHV